MLNDFRYLIMRRARLVFTTISEVGMLLFIALTVGSLLPTFFWIMDHAGYVKDQKADTWAPWALQLALHPWAILLVSVTMVPICLSMAWSFGMPYRFKWRTPGASTKVCRRCGKEIADQFVCEECGCFRPSRAVTAVIQGINMVVTVLWIIHDLLTWFMVLV